MSTLVCWAGVDTHGVSSLYIATDSRITFGGQENGQKWDNGQKAYASIAAPLILGCVGNISYASQIAPRVLSYGECLLQTEIAPEKLIEELQSFSASAIQSVPKIWPFTFEIVLGVRYDTHDFRVSVLSVSESSASVQHFSPPQKSGIVCATGTGAGFVRNRLAKWQETKASDTSRAIYSAFCDALLYQNPPLKSVQSTDMKDPFSEGPPQLVGLYRKWNGRHFGSVWKKSGYFGGVRVNSLPSHLECRNELFERCDPITLRKLDKAKGHTNEVTEAKRRREL